MLALSQIDSHVLAWKQPKWSREYYELKAGRNLIASLGMTKWFSDQAEVQTCSSNWMFDRPDFFRAKGIVYSPGSEVPTARFQFDWLKNCRVFLKDGRRFNWFRTKTFQDAWALTGKDDTLIYEISFGTRWFKRQASITLSLHPGEVSQLDLLLCLGFYIGYCIQQDTAAAVAATSAATSACV